MISEALTRGHKFILFSHHQYNQYKALLCSCSPISISAFMAFLGYFWFWMGDIEVVRWNGVDFLVPKHLRKSKIGLLEQIWAKNPYVTFFWVTLYISPFFCFCRTGYWRSWVEGKNCFFPYFKTDKTDHPSLTPPLWSASASTYDTVSDHLESLSTSVPEILTACRLNGQCSGLYG